MIWALLRNCHIWQLDHSGLPGAQQAHRMSCTALCHVHNDLRLISLACQKLSGALTPGAADSAGRVSHSYGLFDKGMPCRDGPIKRLSWEAHRL